MLSVGKIPGKPPPVNGKRIERSKKNNYSCITPGNSRVVYLVKTKWKVLNAAMSCICGSSKFTKSPKIWQGTKKYLVWRIYCRSKLFHWTEIDSEFFLWPKLLRLKLFMKMSCSMSSGKSMGNSHQLIDITKTEAQWPMDMLNSQYSSWINWGNSLI